jgi:hypothetical protein
MRSQLFYVELHDIPSFVVGHLVRHIHAQPFVKSNRIDRGGVDFTTYCKSLADVSRDLTDKELKARICELPDQFGRLAPQTMSLILSAEELINISRVRLCSCASKETREVWQAVKDKVAEVDADLAKFMVRTCIYRGGICPELRCCGYVNSEAGKKELNEYKNLF